MSILSDLRTLEADVGDLVARHETAENAADFTAYANDPAGFFRDVLRCEPWAKQVDMAEMVRDKPVDKTGTLIVTCNGLGKDWATARIALWWVYARRGFVILTGPTERQVKNILMREVRRAWSVRGDLPGELFAMALHVTDECGILAFTSDDGDKLTGFHHPRLLVCVTEGQGVQQEAYDAARKCCTGADNRLFVYGNPNASAGPFYEAATSGTWDVLTIPASEHPNVVAGREVIPGAVTREWIAQQAREYGDDSPIYLSSVLAQFPTQGSVDSLIRREWLDLAFLRYEAAPNALTNMPLPVVALDVARSTERDESVACIAQGFRAHSLHSWRSRDLVETTARFLTVADQARSKWYGRMVNKTFDETSAVWNDPDKLGPWLDAYGVPRWNLVIDAPGVGGGVVDDAKRRGRTPTEWWGWAPSSNEKKWANLRAEAYWHFRSILESGKAQLPRDPALKEEALEMTWSQDSKGRIIMIAKEDLRKRLGRSPDHLDSAVMSLFVAGGGKAPPRISFFSVEM